MGVPSNVSRSTLNFRSSSTTPSTFTDLGVVDIEWEEREIMNVGNKKIKQQKKE
jgi:hypothetical protein